MGHLGYQGLKIFKDLSTRIDFKETTLKELCSDCYKRNQIYQPSRSAISQSTEYLDQVYNNSKRFSARQGKTIDITLFLLKRIKDFLIQLFKCKNDALIIFKNYNALYKKQSDYQLKVLHTNGKKEYIGEFNTYF